MYVQFRPYLIQPLLEFGICVFKSGAVSAARYSYIMGAPAADAVIILANYEALTGGILGVLVLAGVINSPTSGKWYGDKTE